MSIALIDSHAHLDYDGFDPVAMQALVDQAAAAGVQKIIHIGSSETCESYRQATQVAELFPQVFFSLGVHPHDAKVVDLSVIEEIEGLSAHEKCVAVGEVGLDFYYNHSDAAEQKEALRLFIQLAARLKKPLSIHTRNADQELLEIFLEEKAAEVGGVIHCFSSDYAFAKKMIDLNFYISFSGIVTFKKATEIQEAAAKIPLERMLVETDSPFLAPIPYRGKKNQPAYVLHTAQKIAELRSIDVELVAQKTTENAELLFGI